MGLLARARSVETGTGRPGGSHATTADRRGLLARCRLARETAAGRKLYSAPIAQHELEQARAAPSPERALPAEPAAPVPRAPSVERLLEALRQVPEGIDAPGRLFALLTRELQLTRAALLLWDPARSVFAPWASCGLDQTTLHRLRIPAPAGQGLAPLAAGEVLVLADPDAREPLRRYFSTREHATMERLLLAPLRREERLLALLLVTQCRTPVDEQFARCLRAVGPEAASLLHRSRERHLGPLEPRPLDGPETARQRVLAAAQAAAARGHRLGLVRVCLQPAVQRLTAGDPFADAFRLTEDLQRLVRAMWGPLGGVVRLDSGALLLTVSGVPEPDLELLVAHLRAGLRSLAPRLEEEAPLDLQEQVRTCEPSAEEAAACLAELQ